MAGAVRVLVHLPTVTGVVVVSGATSPRLVLGIECVLAQDGLCLSGSDCPALVLVPRPDGCPVLAVGNQPTGVVEASPGSP